MAAWSIAATCTLPDTFGLMLGLVSGLRLSHLLLNLEALTGSSLVLCPQSNPVQGLNWICRLLPLHRAARCTSGEQSLCSALSRVYCLFVCPQVFKSLLRALDGVSGSFFLTGFAF
uniref:Putative secreted protein n=1 Tax=Ixodes ricinus TaxID=34613 RepID=A0A6B0ULP5_IXORI